MNELANRKSYVNVCASRLKQRQWEARVPTETDIGDMMLNELRSVNSAFTIRYLELLIPSMRNTGTDDASSGQIPG